MASPGNKNYPSQDLSGTFRCNFPSCNAKYRRKEHLRRHEAKHFEQQAFSCSHCGHKFGRSDTLRRHVRQRHKISEPLNRAERACEGCHAGKLRCEGGVPCDECLRRNIRCSFDDRTVDTERPGSLTRRASSPMHEQPQSNHSEKGDQYIGLYFKEFHPFWPFIHRSSFNMRRETPLLLQSMTVIGLWASGEPNAQSAAVEIHGKLDLAIHDQKGSWDVSDEDEAPGTSPWPIATYQAILLHIIFSLVLRSRDALNFDFKVTLPSADFEILEALVRTCRRRGMFFYPNMLTRFKEVGILSFSWVCTEEVKRFNLALYKACGKVSDSNLKAGSQGHQDIARPLLTASDLQFPPPKIDVLWNAIGRNEWLAIIKDEKSLYLDDNCQEAWISNLAGVLEFLEI